MIIYCPPKGGKTVFTRAALESGLPVADCDDILYDIIGRKEGIPWNSFWNYYKMDERFRNRANKKLVRHSAALSRRGFIVVTHQLNGKPDFICAQEPLKNKSSAHGKKVFLKISAKEGLFLGTYWKQILEEYCRQRHITSNEKEKLLSRMESALSSVDKTRYNKDSV